MWVKLWVNPPLHGRHACLRQSFLRQAQTYPDSRFARSAAMDSMRLIFAGISAKKDIAALLNNRRRDFWHGWRTRKISFSRMWSTKWNNRRVKSPVLGRVRIASLKR